MISWLTLVCFGQKLIEIFAMHAVVLTSGHRVWCVNVFLGLEYRFPPFGSIGNLYGFSLYSITYFTGILDEFIFHFGIVPMSLELCTNTDSTFNRNALMSKYVSILLRSLRRPRRLFVLISHYSCHERPAGGAVQHFVLQ